MKVVLINDTSAWYHYGCFLTSSGLKQLINERYELIDSIPIHEIYPLHLDFDSAKSLTPSALEAFVKHNQQAFARLEKADVVIVNGEGSIHGESPFVWRLFSLIGGAKLLLEKSVFIVNHSVFPDDGARYNGATTDSLYRTVYELADYVAARDRTSCGILHDLGIPCMESFDCSVIGLEAKKVPKERQVVVGASAAYASANLEAFLDAFRQLSLEGWDCCFIFGAPARPARDDQRFIAECAALGGGLRVKEPADAAEFVLEIGRSSLVVSGRFHYTIVAHCLRTPFVVLGTNTPKNEALCSALGSPAPISWSAADLGSRILRAAEVAPAETSGGPSLSELCALARKNLP